MSACDVTGLSPTALKDYKIFLSDIKDLSD